MTNNEAIYRIIDPLRSLSVVEAEANGFICVNRKPAELWIGMIKQEVVEALEAEEDDGR